MNKRIISMFCAVLLFVGLVPTSAYASSYDTLVEQFTDSKNVDDTIEMQDIENLNLFSGVAVADAGDYTYEEQEPNDSIEEPDYAFSDSTIVGSLSKEDLVDYFCVVVTSKSEVVVASAATEAELTIGILNGKEDVVKVGKDLGVTDGFHTDGMSVTLDAGVYYIAVTNTASVKTDLTYAFYYVETPVGVERISGKGRYETSEKILSRYKEIYGVDKLDTVILASGKNFADALAGSYLSAICNAPILIVDDSLDMNMFSRHVNKGATVYVLGGTAAVSWGVEKSLADYDVERLSGKDRYETNLKILEKCNDILQRTLDVVLVCTGSEFADSLSASATGLPILLVDNNKLTDGQRAFLNDSCPEDIFILGGESAVNKKMESAVSRFGIVSRISGKNRYETSVKIAETFFPGAATAVLASGKNFPDGLCGGPVAYTMYAPLILTTANSETAAVKYMKDNNINSGLVLGGTSALSDATAKKVFGVNQIDLY